jgi:AcrR family transcriptional regulator
VNIYLHHLGVPHKHGNDRQADIADAILRIVGGEGIAALTMERLGRELGITSGALFRHFPSRAAMLNEAAHRAVALLEATFPPADLAPLERLRLFVETRTRLAAEHAGIPQLVFSEQFGKAMPPKGARALRGIVLRTRDFLVDTLREAGLREEVRRDIPAEELATTVIGVMFARTLLASVAGAGHGQATEVGPTWRSLLALLGPPAPAPSRQAFHPPSGSDQE